MKKFWNVFWAILGIALWIGALVSICTGSGEWFDWFILILDPLFVLEDIRRVIKKSNAISPEVENG